MIVARQRGASWGKAIVERLSADLRAEFPGVSGFSSQNLWYMRQFYSEYCGTLTLQPLVGEISWAKHLVIMARCKDPLEREFYIRMTRKFDWSKNVLRTQGPTAWPGGDRQVAGGWGVNRAAELAAKIREDFEETGA